MPKKAQINYANPESSVEVLQSCTKFDRTSNILYDHYLPVIDENLSLEANQINNFESVEKIVLQSTKQLFHSFDEDYSSSVIQVQFVDNALIYNEISVNDLYLLEYEDKVDLDCILIEKNFVV